MPMNFSDLVYLPCFDAFARIVTFNPVASQPGQPAYAGRGIYDTAPVDVLAEESSIISDQNTILDVLEAEFSVLPQQGDRVTIPSDGGLPDLGEFEIIGAKTNGGGETTFVLRKWVTARP